MINFDFLSKLNNETINDFYEITEGKIIIGGSFVLKINNILDRPVGNLNLVLNQSDSKYMDDIVKHYDLTFISKQNYGLENETYWFRKDESHGVLFLSEDLNFDIFDINNIKLRVNTVDNIKYNKESLIHNNDTNSLKHHRDIELIEKFYGREFKKSII